jgi:hypothetical protein
VRVVPGGETGRFTLRLEVVSLKKNAEKDRNSPGGVEGAVLGDPSEDVQR